MRSSQRGPLSPSRLVALRNQVPARLPARKRPATAVANELATRLRAMGVAVVPANAWSILHATFGTRPEWSLAKIAAFLDCDGMSLATMINQITVAIARYDEFIDLADFLAAVRTAREAM